MSEYKFKLGAVVKVKPFKFEYKVIKFEPPKADGEPQYLIRAICGNLRVIQVKESEIFLSGNTEENKIYHESVLLEAEQLVNGDRNDDYGHPLDDFTKTAKFWSVIAGVEITAEQVGLMMCALKISRHMNRPKRDNLSDLAGYSETIAMCEDERNRRADLSVSFGDEQLPAHLQRQSD